MLREGASAALAQRQGRGGKTTKARVGGRYLAALFRHMLSPAPDLRPFVTRVLGSFLATCP
jgi:hypothetical protein